jgi:hypothetical protein
MRSMAGTRAGMGCGGQAASRTPAAVLVHTVFIRQQQVGRSNSAPFGATRRLSGKDIRKRPARQRSNPIGRTGLKGMNASGRQTAPLPVSWAAVLVTNSACLYLLEAIPRVPDPFCSQQAASSSGAAWTQCRSSLDLLLHPSVHAASRSRTLSVTSRGGV